MHNFQVLAHHPLEIIFFVTIQLLQFHEKAMKLYFKIKTLLKYLISNYFCSVIRYLISNTL